MSQPDAIVKRVWADVEDTAKYPRLLPAYQLRAEDYDALWADAMAREDKLAALGLETEITRAARIVGPRKPILVLYTSRGRVTLVREAKP